jgi:hypothetical protein
MSASSWPERCRQRLLPALESVRLILERHLTPGEGAGSSSTLSPGLEPACPEARAALDHLIEAFSLSQFEASVVLLCVGVELDPRIALACARAHGEASRRYASFGLALSALPGAHFGATAPVAPLRHFSLVRLEPGEGLVERPLRIDERVLHYLNGVSYLDQALDGSVQPFRQGATLEPSQLETARRAAAWLRHDAARGPRPVLHITGAGRVDRLALAECVCDELGLALHVLRAVDLPPDPRRREELARIWAREAVLARGALLVESEGLDSASARQALVGFLDAAFGVLLLSGDEAPDLRARRLIGVPAHLPTSEEQRALWSQALPELDAEAFDPLVAQFSLSADAISSLAAEARQAPPGDRVHQLWQAARRRVRPDLGGLAQTIEAKAAWDLLVLPDAQRSTLREIATHVRQRQRVHQAWGFARRSSRGLGISALFAGPSGTGKTMAAEVLAAELELDLVHVDLSRVVSKYIGETERNLSRIFDATERAGAILLFDEADALFGSRSEVKDSHDRYANIEVSYLLQRMEAYRGLAVLTTNRENNLDPAFLRRIRFVVRFPYPEPEQRAGIWRCIFPEQTPTVGLDPERLGQLNVAGGNIRNIALHAAFLAAGEQAAVNMRHCADAARSELRKLGVAPPERELRTWQ